MREDANPYHAYDPNEDILVEGNQIYDITPATNVGTGVNIAGGHNIRVIGNSIDTVNYNGIVCWGGPTYYYTYQVLIAENIVRNVGESAGGSALESGIRVTNTRDFQVLDNELDGCPSNGVDLAGVVRDFVVRTGPMRRITLVGVSMTTTADDTAALLDELWTDLGETAPATATSGDGVICGTIADTGDDAVYIGESETEVIDGMLVDVSVRDSGGYGVYALKCSGARIRGTTRRCAEAGVRVGDSTLCDISVTSIQDTGGGAGAVNSTYTLIHDCLVDAVPATAAIWDDVNSTNTTAINNVIVDSTVVLAGTTPSETSENREL